ncbi:hypothetical protein BJ912DRAFT_995840 [Pholiota molesta]|nr:hypothetical protein BJ912DRAFT_995840 [Pholiota molesta]
MHASTFYRKRIFVLDSDIPEPHYLRSLVATLIEYVVGYFIPFVACVEWTSSLSVTDFRALANSRGTVEPLFRLSGLALIDVCIRDTTASNARGTEASSTIVYSLLFYLPRMYPIRQAILTLSLQRRNRIISHLLLQLLAKRRRRIKIRSAPFLPYPFPSFFFTLFLPLPSWDELRRAHSTWYPQRIFILCGGTIGPALFARWLFIPFVVLAGVDASPTIAHLLLHCLPRVFRHARGGSSLLNHFSSAVTRSLSSSCYKRRRAP